MSNSQHDRKQPARPLLHAREETEPESPPSPLASSRAKPSFLVFAAQCKKEQPGSTSANEGKHHDIVHGMSLKPSSIHGRRTLHMVTLQDVLGIVAEIDGILAREFGGKGRGIHSKLDSVRPPLPTRLDKRLRYFEAVRNKAVMQPDWRIPDRSSYITECQTAARRLHDIARTRERRRRLLATLRRSRGNLGTLAMVMIAICVFLLLASGSLSLSI